MIIDGKKVRHGGVEIVNAVNSAGRFLGSVLTQSKSNEIPACISPMTWLHVQMSEGFSSTHFLTRASGCLRPRSLNRSVSPVSEC